MTASESTYQAGDQIDIGGAVVTLCRQKGNNGYRWSWVVEQTDEGGQSYLPTPEAAIEDARRTMNTRECRHGQRGWCPDCHDGINR